jgi:hypothetical protein
MDTSDCEMSQSFSRLRSTCERFDQHINALVSCLFLLNKAEYSGLLIVPTDENQKDWGRKNVGLCIENLVSADIYWYELSSFFWCGADTSAICPSIIHTHTHTHAHTRAYCIYTFIINTIFGGFCIRLFHIPDPTGTLYN